ncbi:major royal jelly protein [Sclerotinia borealis F-4128]|uniref:Major royal jelly protein n=1 Tax=Sclerotinia borealis (strain F-4128) TaxID=1432307 RepID=W9CC81_SCLBF|nr:major royal jelly protein [Sclerotinia borealis F-4128]
MLGSILTSLLISAPSSFAAALTPGLELAYTDDQISQHKDFSSRLPVATKVPPCCTYPDVVWNSYSSDANSTSDAASTFVSVDGNGSSKLVGVNLTTNTVDKLYYLDGIITSNSGIDDVRFGPTGKLAYLSDTAGALIILNLTSEAGIRVLADDPSAVAHFPMAFKHTLLEGYGYGSGYLSVGLDQIEVSPDGVYFYYQPCNGGIYRIETRYLNASLTNNTLAAFLGDLTGAFAETPSTGGTTIDADGNIYVSDTNLIAIWKITKDGYASILVQDDALVWTDLMWVTADNTLWLPASQMRPGGNGLLADGPNNIFTFPIDAGPSPIDHA